MKMRFMGGTGIQVSELCFGTMTLGGRGYFKNVGALGLKEATKLVDMSLEAGINFFDTADVYSRGLSEEL